MKIQGLTAVLAITLILGWLLGAGSNYSISSAQNDQTPTPQATRIPADADLLKEFEASLEYETGPRFSEDKACELPCWWGMTPSITSDEDVISILKKTPFFRNWNQPEAFDSSSGPIAGGIALDMRPDVYWTFYILFVADQGKLDYIEMRVVEPNLWFPTNIFDLETILTMRDTLPIIHVFFPGRSFHLIVEYPGILVDYSYHFLDDPTQYTLTEERRLNSISICPEDHILHEINITLFDPNDQEFLDEQIYDHDYFVPLNEITNVDVDTLVNFFTETPDECIELTLSE